jgi:hypothetical protein
MWRRLGDNISMERISKVDVFMKASKFIHETGKSPETITLSPAGRDDLLQDAKLGEWTPKMDGDYYMQLLIRIDYSMARNACVIG